MHRGPIFMLEADEQPRERHQKHSNFHSTENVFTTSGASLSFDWCWQLKAIVEDNWQELFLLWDFRSNALFEQI